MITGADRHWHPVVKTWQPAVTGGSLGHQGLFQVDTNTMVVAQNDNNTTLTEIQSIYLLCRFISKELFHWRSFGWITCSFVRTTEDDVLRLVVYRVQLVPSIHPLSTPSKPRGWRGSWSRSQLTLWRGEVHVRSPARGRSNQSNWDLNVLLFVQLLVGT